MTLAGLKKWVPMTLSGRAVTEATSSTLSVDVLVAKIHSGLVAVSNWAKTCILTSMFSNTASTTKSTSPRAV